jgi:hypothetical protein
MWLCEVASLLRENGFNNAPRFELPIALCRFVALFSNEMKKVSRILGEKRETPANKAMRLLGWSPRDVRESIVKSAHQAQSLTESLASDNDKADLKRN